MIVWYLLWRSFFKRLRLFWRSHLSMIESFDKIVSFENRIFYKSYILTIAINLYLLTRSYSTYTHISFEDRWQDRTVRTYYIRISFDDCSTYCTCVSHTPAHHILLHIPSTAPNQLSSAAIMGGHGDWYYVPRVGSCLSLLVRVVILKSWRRRAVRGCETTKDRIVAAAAAPFVRWGRALVVPW